MNIRQGLSQIFAVLMMAIAIPAGLAAPAAADEMLVVRNLADPGKPEARLTEEDLLALPQVTVRTRTEFTDGVVEFVGPLARDAIARVGGDGAALAHLVAANDYAVDAPLSDFTNYDVILAMTANGERLSRRDKGPIWLIYPLDDHEELKDPVYTIRLIWQLTAMELR